MGFATLHPPYAFIGIMPCYLRRSVWRSKLNPESEESRTCQPSRVPHATGQKTVLAACPHDCPDTCSMLVTVENDRVVKVRGNPDHPFTDGRLCVKVNHYEERVHHPDRVLYPLKRSGPKGSGQFARITWQAAIEEIVSRWKQISKEHGPTAILPYSYLGTEGILNGLNVGDAFFNRMGATISERTFCDSGACTGYIMTVGPTPGHRPGELRPLALHHPVGVQHDQHQPASLALHRRGPEARRQGRGGGSSAHAHRAAGGLAHPDQARNRRRPGHGDDPRHHQRRV